MSKKTSPIKGPPQKTVTRAPGPTTDIGGGVVFRSPVERLTSEDLKKLPKKTPELPRRIDGNDLMKRWNKKDFELVPYVKELDLPVYYHSGELMPKDSPYLTINEYSIFDLSEVEEFEEKYPELLKEKVATRSAGQDEENNILPHETFIRNLKISHENDSEIKIQERGRSPATYNCKMLGFRDETTEEWKTFLNILQEPNFTYNVGKAYTYSQDGSEFIKKRNKSYDRNQRRLKQINAKLVNFLNKNYSIQIPKDFKLYELDKKEKKGTYRFKFQAIFPNVLEAEAKTEYDNLIKEQALKKLEELAEKYRKSNFRDDKAEETFVTLNNIAKEKGWITEGETAEMLQPGISRRNIKYDSHENTEDQGPDY